AEEASILPTTTSPIATPVMNPVVPADTSHDAVPVHDSGAPAMSGPEKPGGALATRPPSHDLHSKVQGAASRAPPAAGGPAGGAQGSPVDPRKAAQAFM